MNTGYWNYWGEEGTGGLKMELKWPFQRAKFLVLLIDNVSWEKRRWTRTTGHLARYMFSPKSP